jgi:hypothetical protein
MPLNLTEASGILKEFYLPTVREQINNKVLLLSQLERNSDDVEGEEAVLSLHVQRNSGVGNIGDGGTLPAPGNQKYTKERVKLRTITGRIRFTVQAMKAMKSNRSSWERTATSETKRMTNDIRRDVNRQLAGTSDGTIATTAANAAVNVIALAAATTAVQMRHFEKGMFIDISTAAAPGDAAKLSAREITAVDRAAKTITVGGAAVTTAAGDRVERKGNGGAVGGSTQKEFTGLQTIVSATGTLHNVDPTVHDVWKSFVDNPGGAARTVTENLLEKAQDEVDIAGEGNVSLWLVPHGVSRNYSNQLTSLKRFPNTLTLKGGFKALSVSSGVGEAALIAERDIPAASAFGVDTEHLFVKEWCPLEWLEDPEVLRQTPDKLEYEGTAYWIVDMCTDARNSHAFVGTLAES